MSQVVVIESPTRVVVRAPGLVGLTGPQGATGATGATGPAGPTAVSSDAGNQATLGTDSKIYITGLRAETRSTFSNANHTYPATTRFLAQVGTMSAARVVTLPAANAVPVGAELIVADQSGTVTTTNTITVQRAGSDTINGGTSVVIGQAYGWRRFVSDGVAAWIYDGGVLRGSNNLSDVASASTALANLGGVAQSLYDANTILAATTDDTPTALTVGASTVVGRAASGGIVALTGSQIRTITGLATTDSPTFGGGTVGAASTGPTLSAELGDGVSLTQALTGLTVGRRYQVQAVSGTLTAATLDGAALACVLNATSFIATTTSHTVVGTTGTATAISVKGMTAAAATAPIIGGTSVRARNQSHFVGGGTGGQWLTTGSYNNAVGQAALYALTTGSYNNAVGHSALYALTTGSYNSAVGHAALSALTTGSSNNAVGHAALYALTTGSGNNAVGQAALSALTTGSYNSAVGHTALYALTTGSYNNAVGQAALYALTTGSYNSAVGQAALSALTTGSGNNAVGQAALYALTAGSGNNAVGQNAGRALTTGSYNLALGNGAAYTGSSGGLSGTVAIGDDSAGTGAVVTADNQFVLGTALHSVRVPGRTTTLGGRVVNLTQTATDRSIGAGDHVVAFTSSATATLPTATTAGQTHVIKAAGAGVTVTLATTSSQTIDGAAPGTVPPWGKVTVVADGANWITI